MTAITTLRGTLATALANPGVWTVYPFPPASPIANCIIISPDNPYIEPQNNYQTTISPKVNLKINVIVPNLDNQGDLAQLESFALQVMQKLEAAALSVTIGDWSAPTQSSSEIGSMLMTDLSISILGTWS